MMANKKIRRKREKGGRPQTTQEWLDAQWRRLKQEAWDIRKPVGGSTRSHASRVGHFTRKINKIKAEQERQRRFK